jgi:hypothetical protein
LGVILLVFCLQILMNGQLPEGFVATPIFSYCALGCLAYLLSYPIKDAQYYWIRQFCKYYFYVQLPLLVFLLIALIRRVQDYNFTENRYLAIVLCLWLIGISVYMILSKLKNIIYIPLTLGILLGITTFGKWGMYSLSSSMQYKRFCNVLSSNNAIVNNKLNTSTLKQLSNSEIEVLQSTLNYLYTRNQLQLLQPILSEADYLQLKKLQQQGYSNLNVGELFGIYSPSNTEEDNSNYLTFFTNANLLFSSPLLIQPYKNIIDFEAQNNKAYPNYASTTDTIYKQCILASDTLYIVKNNDTLIKEHLLPFALAKVYQINTTYADSSILGAIGQLSLPYRQIELNKDSLCYQAINCKVYFTTIKCSNNLNKAKVLYAKGYAIF